MAKLVHFKYIMPITEDTLIIPIIDHFQGNYKSRGIIIKENYDWWRATFWQEHKGNCQ